VIFFKLRIALLLPAAVPSRNERGRTTPPPHEIRFSPVCALPFFLPPFPQTATDKFRTSPPPSLLSFSPGAPHGYSLFPSLFFPSYSFTAKEKGANLYLRSFPSFLTRKVLSLSSPFLSFLSKRMKEKEGQLCLPFFPFSIFRPLFSPPLLSPAPSERGRRRGGRRKGEDLFFFFFLPLS